MFRVVDQPHVAGHGAHAGLLGDFLRGDLVAHLLDRAHGRADKGNTGGVQRLGEFRVLGQETVTGVDRFGARGFDRLHHLVDDDIGLVGGGRADVHRLVRHFHVQRVAVGVGIDGNRLNAHLARGLDDTAGDFTAVGDQDLFEHCGSLKFVVPNAKNRRAKAGRLQHWFEFRIVSDVRAQGRQEPLPARDDQLHLCG